MHKESGYRYVITAKAEPSLSGLEDLTQGGWGPYQGDWGIEASLASRLRLAQTLFLRLQKNVLRETMLAFADEILTQLETGKMWLLTGKQIEEWLQTREIQ